RDWSSDVCSSDLSAVLVPVLIAVGVVLVLAAAALLVFIVMRRQRAAQPATSAAGPTTMTGPGWSGQPGAPDGGYDPTRFTGATVDQPGAWGSGASAGVSTPPGWAPAGQQSPPPVSDPPDGPTGSPGSTGSRWDQQPGPESDDGPRDGEDRESPCQRPR